MPAQPHVALLIDTSNSYARGLLRGVMRDVREHRPWTIFVPETGRGDAPPGWLKRWHGDGIIARIENETIAKIVKQSGVPTINSIKRSPVRRSHIYCSAASGNSPTAAMSGLPGHKLQ